MPSPVDNLAIHGWAAVSRDSKSLLSNRPYFNKPGPLLVKNIPFPSDDDLVVKVQQYARDNLTL